MEFTDLGLSAETLRAVTDAGYKTPTPIQEQAIPYVLMNRDVLGCAQTGTGKTASFTLPMIEILAAGRARARMPRSLILTPTRELAAQISENFEIYGKYHKLNMALLIGGVSFGEQEKKLDRGVDVLIATPGRLIDHIERGRILLTDVKVLVIDEADRMLDMGFIPDVERIVSLLPRIRQTLFFSATMPAEIRRLADAFLSNPKEVTVAPPASPAETVTQGLAIVSGEPKRKREALRNLIRSENVANALIFCNRKRDVDVLARSLRKHGFSAQAMHGDMSQPARTETLAAFKDGKIVLLVATDVAGRGIDIDDLSHVFNFDVPTHADNYVHRIGRTGRAGKSGRAFMLATSEDGKYLQAISALLGKEIPVIEIPGTESAGIAPVEEPRGRERGRRRGGRKTASEPTSPKAEEKRAHPPKTEEKKKADNAPADKKPARGKQPTRETQPAREKQPTREKQSAERPVGLGDHVPAFLLRPMRIDERN